MVRPRGAWIAVVEPIYDSDRNHSAARKPRASPRASPHPHTAAPRVSILDSPHSATVMDLTSTETGWQARIRAAVLPGHMTLRVEIPGLPPSTARLTSTLLPGDFAS